MSHLKSFVVSAAIAAGLLVLASPASATTFCVPGYFEGCPNAGGNQARSSLTAAMSDNGSDGLPDKVIINAGTITETGSIEASGTDPLEVVGAGKAETRISSDVTGNEFVALFDDRPGMEISDLTIAGPVGLGDANGDGAIAQLEDATLTDVDVLVQNSGADGLNLIGDCVITRSRIEASEGGQVDYAVRAGGLSGGHSVVIGSRILNPSYGLVAVGAGKKVDVVLSQVSDPESAGIWAGKGSQVLLQNSVIDTAGERAAVIQPEAGVAQDTVLRIDSSTVFSVGTAYAPALDVSVPGASSAGDAVVTVESSIVQGYDETWEVTVPAGPFLPIASVTFDHSNFVPAGTGDGVDFSSPTNINADPRFITPQDLRLQPDSPSIDAGDPASTLTYDFDAASRPRDGDGDDSSLPDQGAFEFQPTCETVPATCPKDTTSPKLSKVKVRYKRGKGGALRFRVSEASVVRARFMPVPKRGRKTVKLARSFKAGPRRFKLGKRQLKRGRYRVRITATDSAGNVSKAVTRKVKVRR